MSKLVEAVDVSKIQLWNKILGYYNLKTIQYTRKVKDLPEIKLCSDVSKVFK